MNEVHYEGLGLLLTTHDLDFAYAFASHVCIMDGGELTTLERAERWLGGQHKVGASPLLEMSRALDYPAQGGRSWPALLAHARALCFESGGQVSAPPVRVPEVHKDAQIQP